MTTTDPNKTVFISYRRSVSKYIARSIFLDLHQKGYDAFLDVETIDSGGWETIILNQIAARTHFLLVLTPGTLERCSEPNDMLRREIEQAIDLGRNIVLLLAENYDFKADEKYLTGKLGGLPKYNALNLYYDYFDEGMEKLRSRFLKQPTYQPVITPAPPAETSRVKQSIETSAERPMPTAEELNAEQYFVSASEKHQKGEFDSAIADYTKAIQLQPDYPYAYNDRGAARASRGDLDGAIADYNKAIQLKPDIAYAYNNRGIVRVSRGDLDGAIADYTQAIQLQPDYANAYNNKGVAHVGKDDFNAAIADYTQAIRLKSDFFESYYNRGEIYFVQREYDKSLSDFKKFNDLRPGDNFALAGLAITQHALGNLSEAHRLWKLLIGLDTRYKDADWVKTELNWADPLVDEARKLIAEL